MEQANNTFNKGLQLDTHPMVQGNDTLSDALNATFITQNDNEVILQNDMGNRKIDNAYLPSGYQPVGMKEYGGIIYVAAYNPVTNKSQIGSFPSPERKIGEEGNLTGELNIITEKTFTSNLEEEIEKVDNILFLKNSEKLIPLQKDPKLQNSFDGILRPGDKFTVYNSDLWEKQKEQEEYKYKKYISNFDNIEGNKVKSPKNRLYTLSLGIMNSQNEFIDITSSLKRWEDKKIIPKSFTTESDLYKFNSGYFIAKSFSNSENKYTGNDAELISERQKLPINTYSYKLVGPLYLKSTLNHVSNFQYSIEGYKENNGAIIYITANIEYNCPDGVVEKNSGDDIYSTYEEGEVTHDFFDLWIKDGGEYRKDDKEYSIIKTVKGSCKYDPETNLYSTTITKTYKFDYLGELEYYLCVRAFDFQLKEEEKSINRYNIYIKGLSTKGNLDLNKLGSNSVELTGYRFYNDWDEVSNDALTTITYTADAYPARDTEFTNLTMEFYELVEENGEKNKILNWIKNQSQYKNSTLEELRSQTDIIFNKLTNTVSDNTGVSPDNIDDIVNSYLDNRNKNDNTDTAYPYNTPETEEGEETQNDTTKYVYIKVNYKVLNSGKVLTRGNIQFNWSELGLLPRTPYLVKFKYYINNVEKYLNINSIFLTTNLFNDCYSPNDDNFINDYTKFVLYSNNNLESLTDNEKEIIKNKLTINLNIDGNLKITTTNESNVENEKLISEEEVEYVGMTYKNTHHIQFDCHPLYRYSKELYPKFLIINNKTHDLNGTETAEFRSWINEGGDELKNSLQQQLLNFRNSNNFNDKDDAERTIEFDYTKDKLNHNLKFSINQYYKSQAAYKPITINHYLESFSDAFEKYFSNGLGEHSVAVYGASDVNDYGNVTKAVRVAIDSADSWKDSIESTKQAQFKVVNYSDKIYELFNGVGDYYILGGWQDQQLEFPLNGPSARFNNCEIRLKNRFKFCDDTQYWGDNPNWESCSDNIKVENGEWTENKNSNTIFNRKSRDYKTTDGKHILRIYIKNKLSGEWYLLGSVFQGEYNKSKDDYKDYNTYFGSGVHTGQNKEVTLNFTKFIIKKYLECYHAFAQTSQTKNMWFKTSNYAYISNYNLNADISFNISSNTHLYDEGVISGNLNDNTIKLLSFKSSEEKNKVYKNTFNCSSKDNIQDSIEEYHIHNESFNCLASNGQYKDANNQDLNGSSVYKLVDGKLNLLDIQSIKDGIYSYPIFKYQGISNKSIYEIDDNYNLVQASQGEEDYYFKSLTSDENNNDYFLREYKLKPTRNYYLISHQLGADDKSQKEFVLENKKICKINFEGFPYATLE